MLLNWYIFHYCFYQDNTREKSFVRKNRHGRAGLCRSMGEIKLRQIRLAYRLARYQMVLSDLQLLGLISKLNLLFFRKVPIFLTHSRNRKQFALFAIRARS